jgi:hypothetical protein
LEREFGNISEEEYDDEANETENSTHFRNSRKLPNGDSYHKDFPLRDDFSSLRNLVETKSREIEKISALLATERKHHKSTVDEYEKRLTIFESEKERVSISILAWSSFDDCLFSFRR